MDINFAFMLLGQILPHLKPQKKPGSISDVIPMAELGDGRASPLSSVSNAFKEMTDFELMTTAVFRSVCFAKYLPVPVLLGSRNPCFDPVLNMSLI